MSKLSGFQIEAPDAGLEDRLKEFSKREKIPELKRAEEVAEAELVPITVMVPKYVRESLRQKDMQGEGSQRFQVLSGLKAIGHDIADADLVKDRRSARKKR